jgi:predicted MPP superfamily phosphohydrolase
MLAGVGGAIAGYAFLREPLQVRLDRLTLHLPNAHSHLPRQGLRLLHLSDTHFRGANWREQAKIDCIRKACSGLEYDLLIHTGDFLHHDSGLPNILRLLDALPAPRLGGYAVFGNHDYCTYSHDQILSRAWAKFQELQQAQMALHVPSNGAGYSNGAGPESGGAPSSNGYNYKNGAGRVTPLAHARTLYQFGQYCATAPLDFKRSGNNDVNALERALTGRQIHILHNRCVRLTHPDIGLDIYLAGVDDVQEGRPELPRALADIPKSTPTILLSHNPDILTEPGVEQADLVLSGHTHGGQIVLPFFGPAHTQTQHLQRKEVAGYLRRGKTHVYITRGIGEGIPLRLGAAPQVTLITVLPA